MKKVTVIGMDLGDKNNKAVVLDPEGVEVLRQEVPNTTEALRLFLKRFTDALLVIETGTHCRWISRLAKELGVRVVVGNARKLRMIWPSTRKNDWNDACMLAKLGHADPGLLAPVNLREDECQTLLRLVNARDLLVRHRAGIVNLVRGTCKAEGDRLEACGTESFARLEYEVPAALREVTKPLFALLREVTKAGNAQARRLLVVSANYILGPFAPDSDLRRHGLRIAERGGKNARRRAKVSVARKLAVAMMTLLQHRQEYRPLMEAEQVA